MLLLLVKPEARRRRKYSAIVEALVAQGAIEILGSNIEAIRSEVNSHLDNVREEVTVVACGGDGTVHLLINAVMGLRVKFAVIPMGTGNDFARYLGISRVSQALEVISKGTDVAMDIGSIECEGKQRYFLGIASCGFDAQVNERANGYKGPQGTVKYIAALLVELRNLAPISLQITRDNACENHDITLLAIANTTSYGGGMKVAPDAVAYDGSLYIVRVAAVSRSTLLRVFPKVFRGTHIAHPAVTTGDATHVEVVGESFPVYADGERVGFGPATFKVLPGAVKVLHPANGG